MKKIFPLSLILLCLMLFSCGSDASNSAAEAKADEPTAEQKQEITKGEGPIEVVYFHATRRCATCEAIEKVCENFLKENYGDDISFTSVNHEDKSNLLVIRHNASEQSLFVIQGKQKIDLTNSAFMNAKSRPEKLEADLKNIIDQML